MAVAYGADAVYLAGTTFGMRSFAGNFTPEELTPGGGPVPQPGRAGPRHLQHHAPQRRGGPPARVADRVWTRCGVDAVILADVGVMALAGKYAPHVQRHISTQASIVNYETARAWHDLGADRVILARELSLDGDPEDPGQDPAGAGAGGLCPRGHVRELLRAGACCPTI